ncbi:hypothetical protein Tco_1244861 [Tanacetum coccineum]
MESNKSIHRSNEQKNLYKALVDSYESDKLILDTYGETISFKRRRDKEDKDEEPSAGSNRGPREEEREKNQSQPTADESAQAEEPMQTAKDLEEPAHQEFKTGVTEDQPDEETSQLPDWFQKPAKPPTPDHDWNKTLPDAHGPIQPWLSSLAQMEDLRESFNELMDSPIDFSAFVMNQLKVDTLTPELLAGPTFKLMKGSCKSLYLDWITVRRDDDKLYTFKEGDFNRLCIQDIEDMQLFLVQGKLTNLTVEERLAFNNKDKKNRLMRIDELHKFSDGTLNDVRTTLNDRLKEILMKYLPQTICRQSNRDKSGAMILAIDKQLKKGGLCGV